MFAEPSWVLVILGQRIHPQGYHPLVDVYSEDKIMEYLERIRPAATGKVLAQAVARRALQSTRA